MTENFQVGPRSSCLQRHRSKAGGRQRSAICMRILHLLSLKESIAWAKPATTAANHHPWPLAATPTSGKHLCRIAEWTVRHFSPRHWGAPAKNQSDSAATKAAQAVASSQIPAWSSRAIDHPRKDKHRRVNPAMLHVLHSGSVAADSKSRAKERGLSSRNMDAALGSFLDITLRTPDHEVRYSTGNTLVESQNVCADNKTSTPR
jgi:hypothetical protein